jgi:hypothetical protein
MRHPLRRRAVVAGLALSALAAFGSGCATTRPMALSKEQATFAVDPQQSLALSAVKVANVYKPGYQPHVKDIRVRSLGEKSEDLAFTVVQPYRASADEANQFEEFLVSLALAPGTYELTGVRVASGSVLMPGIYLGRIEAVRRERQGDEPRAGPVIPLIDQSVTGFSGGTFDVKLFDGYDHDLPLMRAEYPALRSMTVEKLLLPPPGSAKAAK